METNIIITGLEEYQEKLNEIGECLWKLNVLQEQLKAIVLKMEPKVEFKKAPENVES